MRCFGTPGSSPGDWRSPLPASPSAVGATGQRETAQALDDGPVTGTRPSRPGRAGCAPTLRLSQTPSGHDGPTRLEQQKAELLLLGGEDREHRRADEIEH